MKDAYKDDIIQQIFARLTVHEAILEFMMANAMAGIAKDQADAILQHQVESMRSMYVNYRANVDLVHLRTLEADAIELMTGFCRKVARRADAAREQLPPD